MLPAILNELRDRRVVIVGFGREGRSTWRLLREAFPGMPLAVADRNPVMLPVPDPATALLCGPDYLDALDGFDVMVKSPGVPLLGVPLPPGLAVTSQTDLFLRHAGCRTIGVTGTKGKSTTSSLIHRILEADGRHALLLGNIGVPVLDRAAELRPDSIAVLELSCNQLLHAKGSPDIAVITNLYPEHLDHYASYDDYAEAKMNILRHQGADGICVFNSDHEELRMRVARTACGRLVPVSLADASAQGLDKLAELNPNLAGRHNLYDALLASAAARAAGASGEAVRAGLASFPGIPHRMQDIGTWRGIRFYDNSIATVPVATLYALETLAPVDTVIVGGLDRGLDLKEFTDTLAASAVRTVICMPDTGAAVRDRLAAVGAPQLRVWADDMDTAVRLCFEHTPSGGVCLLSPTASSYNRYKSFEEKGDEFKQWVRKYGSAGEERGTE
ncbi:MAG: UDP-N-acetylmuramoyl-L-alanine--D-glutamate ligase [Clostridia bacterium]|nr:UDP-N-acetylmuramoyl-L-alanine--D-glutamate ligase [Clostridia bacterium]